MTGDSLLSQAVRIWQAGVDAVRPETLLPQAMDRMREDIARARRIIVTGAGKAGSAMSAALEDALGEHLAKVEGLVNVPEGTERPLQKIRLHPARPAGSNHPTAAGVVGSEAMLALMASAGREDIAVCLLSGGGSALLPAPADGITLEDKQAVTRLLHACGATIHEMNAVRKHLSRIKGGRLVQGFRGQAIHSLIISDVVGDPLDVIASGPTAADPSTFADALTILDRHGLTAKTPPAVLNHLRAGAAGSVAETLKACPPFVHNRVLGNNRLALDAAGRTAAAMGYHVIDLGSFIEGETGQVAIAMAGVVRSIRSDGRPRPAPVCLLSGGETTVNLTAGAGKGGRNQEFVLSMLAKLGRNGMTGVAVLSGGTDGEDGPTDAAGAVADENTFAALSPAAIVDALARHDAWPLLDSVGALLKTGLTQTNVMDVRVILVRDR